MFDPRTVVVHCHTPPCIPPSLPFSTRQKLFPQSPRHRTRVQRRDLLKKYNDNEVSGNNVSDMHLEKHLEKQSIQSPSLEVSLASSVPRTQINMSSSPYALNFTCVKLLRRRGLPPTSPPENGPMQLFSSPSQLGRSNKKLATRSMTSLFLAMVSYAGGRFKCSLCSYSKALRMLEIRVTSLHVVAASPSQTNMPSEVKLTRALSASVPSFDAEYSQWHQSCIILLISQRQEQHFISSTGEVFKGPASRTQLASLSSDAFSDLVSTPRGSQRHVSQAYLDTVKFGSIPLLVQLG